jgi:hypothetical protein
MDLLIKKTGKRRNHLESKTIFTNIGLLLTVSKVVYKKFVKSFQDELT